MIPKRWYKRKTTYPAMIGAGLAILGGATEFLHTPIPYLNNGLWLCLFLTLGSLRDGVEYNKVKAKRILFNRDVLKIPGGGVQ